MLDGTAWGVASWSKLSATPRRSVVPLNAAKLWVFDEEVRKGGFVEAGQELMAHVPEAALTQIFS